MMNEYQGKCKLDRDVLVLKGRCYTIDNIHLLPEALNPRNASEKSDDTGLAFFGIHSPFSNFHKCEFTLDQQRYNCTEQYIQAEKACLFDDDLTAERIMNSDSPYEIKQLGNNVRNYMEQNWYTSVKQSLW